MFFINPILVHLILLFERNSVDGDPESRRSLVETFMSMVGSNSLLHEETKKIASWKQKRTILNKVGCRLHFSFLFP